MDKNSAVGFFDSGIGGLNVLFECKKLLPHEDFVYLSDEKNAPYGTKTDAEIFGFCEVCITKLILCGVKAVVVACNTATNTAIRPLRAAYPSLPIIGVEPAVMPAVKFMNAHVGTIAVMTTLATSRQDKFINLVQEARALSKNPIKILPLKNLATLIEHNLSNKQLLKVEIERIFENEKEQIGAVVLGCTHYIYIKDIIDNYFDGKVRLFDGNSGTANRLKNILTEFELLNPSNTFGKTSFIF